MAEDTQVPKGLPVGVPLIRVTDENNRVSFAPLTGAVDPGGGGELSVFSTLRQPARTDEPENTTPVTGTNLLANRNGTLPTFGLTVMAQPYAADPEQADEFLRGTGGDVYDQGVGPDFDVVLTDRQAQDTRAFLYGLNETDGDAKPVLINDDGAVVVSSAAAATLELVTADDQATAAGANTSIAAANAARRQIIIQNVDDTDAVRIGDTNITTTRGIRLAPGESVTLGADDLRITEEIFARAEANTPAVAVTEIQAV